MGWRDINMNRKKPQPRLTVIPVEAGMDFTRAVLRKAAADAVAALRTQLGANMPADFSPFVSGYLLGYARQCGLKHGVDCETEPDGMAALAEALAEVGCIDFSAEPQSLSFSPRGLLGSSQRAALRATPALADAGYLVGHLEALCGSARLARLAIARTALGAEAGARAYLTDCDTAADPLQTRQPTMSLRFTPEEREAIIAGFAELLKAG